MGFPPHGGAATPRAKAESQAQKALTLTAWVVAQEMREGKRGSVYERRQTTAARGEKRG